MPRPTVLPNRNAGRSERLSAFLSGHDGDCLLALPARSGATEATIDAFAAEPDAVTRLGAAFQRASGVAVRATSRQVSRDQCSALTFARALPQYPDYPLRLSLTASKIASGARLEGVVSGLRKPWLSVLIVDDEGKTQLVQHFDGLRSSVVSFSANMTLTSGPVAAEQLLVAVAADEPIQSVPGPRGMPAEEYFSRLATEIMTQNRSILFGITSFIVH